MLPPRNSRGFTLIELSIVLVIIGLLVGGVLVGRNLMLVGERQKVLSEWEDLNTQVNTFELKYGALPGDIPNADQLFAGSSNGDGDGAISNPTFLMNFARSGYPMERCQFWYHLSAAKLIKGGYPICVNDTTVLGHTPPLPFNPKSSYVVSAGIVVLDCGIDIFGTPCEAPVFSKEHWIWTTGLVTGWSLSFSGTALTPIGFSDPDEGVYTNAPFTVDDVRWFDRKVDDGKALTGKLVLMGYNGYLSSDAPGYSCSDSASPDQYASSITTRDCHLGFKLEF